MEKAQTRVVGAFNQEKALLGLFCDYEPSCRVSVDLRFKLYTYPDMPTPSTSSCHDSEARGPARLIISLCFCDTAPLGTQNT